MRFWFVFPLTLLMLSPLWLERYDPLLDGRDGVADGSTGIPPHYADGSTGIPPHYADGSTGIPPH
ncbi:MAG: hypothetical protein LJF15_18630 [Acidobacteria bacterium]|jgi:hypothetical protein|nr:hypothetical protein [Acidobacteriota bacterium]